MKKKLLITISLYLFLAVLNLFLWDYFDKILLIERILVILLVNSIIIYLIALMTKVNNLYQPFLSLWPLLVTVKVLFDFNSFSAETFVLIFNLSLWLFVSLVAWLKKLKRNNILLLKREINNQRKYKVLSEFMVFYLLPTILLFGLLLIPIAFIKTVNNQNLNLSTLMSEIICLTGLIIYLISNLQAKSLAINPKGLWSKSRYPDYFGEIIFVIGFFLMTLSLDDGLWYLFLSPLVHLLMYSWFIIPKTETIRLKTIQNYPSYQQKTNLLIPIFNKDEKKH